MLRGVGQNFLKGLANNFQLGAWHFLGEKYFTSPFWNLFRPSTHPLASVALARRVYSPALQSAYSSTSVQYWTA